MSLVIGTNVSSLAAQRSLNESSKLMETAMERLSSGKMINSGADDAAGLAKSMKMDGQIASLGQAGKNITEGKALVSAIDASLEEVTDILVRAKELAVQASSDTVSATDRARIKNEYSALTAQLDQISSNTRYNGMEVLNGTFTGKQIQVGAKGGETITVAQTSVKSNALGGEAITGGARIVVATANGSTYSTTTGRSTGSTTAAGDTLKITVGGVSTWSGVTNFGGTADMNAGDFATQINLYTGQHGVSAQAHNYAFLDFTNAIAAAHTIGINGVSMGAVSVGSASSDLDTLVTVINSKSSETNVTARNTGTDIELFNASGHDIQVQNLSSNTTITVQNGEHSGARETGTGAVALQANTSNDTGIAYATIKLTGDGDFTITEAGATTQNNITFKAQGDTVSSNDYLNGAALDTLANARSAISTIDGALNVVAKMRGDLGAIENRLEHSFDSVLAERTSIEAAQSAVLDADFAAESANLAKAQVLQQVGTAMLAQANAQPQLVLQLVQ